ncbi:hypothetical protein VFPFJ_07413 [Purpureocillium lilacinum]|uniref:Protamine P1 n=1 Tax=Purpureocillium lilacinum TaxID=33203 RepID=A0A179HH45_PURLI|nr:hypothetical protein VFPFJ_07413 [Purpureocillium lilacinum]OAQ88948.1 hypothetical protein VFPFJ_07413 [Purpureocillium lilacinum]
MAVFPAQPLPDWEEDDIYAEAVCDVDDIYYHGSEDEDYDSPTTRRQRYEAAGQRFLDGSVPFLLSASLQGPFDKESGWTNPWRSKQRVHSGAALFAVTKDSLPLTWHAAEEAELSESDLECHLPSPESLKQAPVTEKHPHLEDEALSMIQDWRTSIHLQSPSRDSFWAASKAQITASAKKRRARESEWLKRVASKKRKLESSEPSFSKSPLARRNSNSRVLRVTEPLALGNPDGCPADSSPTARRLKSIPPIGGLEAVDAAEDELTTSTPGGSFDSHRKRVPNTPKRVSPRRDMWKCVLQSTGLADDELSQNEAAAATLSSPVSQRGGLVASGRRAAKPDRRTTVSSVAVESWPIQKHEAVTGNCETQDQNMDKMEEGDALGSDIDAPIAPPPATQLETQMDSSFCFKIRQRPGQSDKERLSTVAVDQPDLGATDHTDTLVKCVEDEHSDGSVDRQVTEPPMAAVSASNDCKDISSHGDAQGTSAICNQTAEDAKCAPQEQISDCAPAQKRSAGDDASPYSTDGAKDATSPFGDGTDAPERSSSGALVSLEMQSDEHGNGAIKQFVNDALAREDCAATGAASTSNGQAEQDLAREPDIEIFRPSATPTKEPRKTQPTLEKPNVSALGSAVSGEPLKVECEGQEGWKISSTNPETPSLTVFRSVEITNSSTAMEDPEPILEASMVPENNRAASTEPSRPAPTMQSSEFSFKNILNRLVPSSPWARLSQLTSCSEAKADDATADVKSTASNTTTESESDVAGIEAMDVDKASFHQENVDALQPEDAETDNPMIGLVVRSNDQQEEATNTPQKAPDTIITESQQTPWDKTQLLTRPTRSSVGDCDESTFLSSGDNSAKTQGTQAVIPPEAQSPWGGIGEIPVFCGNVSGKRLEFQDHIEATPIRPGIEDLQDPHSKPDPQQRGRAASPPPATPIGDLPTSQSDKFRKHFAAVASRTDGLRQKLIPTASQQVAQSPGMQGMAVQFLAADDAAAAEPTCEPTHTLEDSKAGTDRNQGEQESQEPMDVVEDLLCEMDDLLQVWDVDAELDQARRSAGPGVQRVDMAIGSQSPW